MIQPIITAIDTFQGVKTTFIKAYVPNEELRKPLQTFIDAQSSFAKKIVSETNAFFTTVGYSFMTMDTNKAFATK
jgi:hypothetical protein